MPITNARTKNTVSDAANNSLRLSERLRYHHTPPVKSIGLMSARFCALSEIQNATSFTRAANHDKRRTSLIFFVLRDT